MTRIIAHRGSSKLYPENSLRAFRHAVESGADALEVDLRQSADGKLFCFHDHHLSRLTRHRGYFSRTHSKVLSRMMIADSDPILAFGDFLEEFSGRLEIVLDIKSSDIEREILESISQKYLDMIIFSSFNSRTIARIKALNRLTRTALIVGPMRNMGMGLSRVKYLGNKLAKLGCEAIHLSYRSAGKKLVKNLEAAGFGISVWTVDDEHSAHRFVELGVNGIFTNVAEKLVQFFHAHPNAVHH